MDRSGGVYGGAELALLEQTGTYTLTCIILEERSFSVYFHFNSWVLYICSHVSLCIYVFDY